MIQLHVTFLHLHISIGSLCSHVTSEVFPPHNLKQHTQIASLFILHTYHYWKLPCVLYVSTKSTLTHSKPSDIYADWMTHLLRSTAITTWQCFLQSQPICQINKLDAYLLDLAYSTAFPLLKKVELAIVSHLNSQGTRIPRGMTYTFLDNRSCITLIVVFFGARGPCPHLLSAAHMKDGHTGCHTHT